MHKIIAKFVMWDDAVYEATLYEDTLETHSKVYVTRNDLSIFWIHKRHLGENLETSIEKVVAIWIEAFDEGRSAGFEAGENEGYREGFNEGHRNGHEEGRKEGYDEGYENGHEQGYEEGYEQG